MEILNDQRTKERSCRRPLLKGENSQSTTEQVLEGDLRFPCIHMREHDPDAFHSESMSLLINHAPV